MVDEREMIEGIEWKVEGKIWKKVEESKEGVASPREAREADVGWGR